MIHLIQQPLGAGLLRLFVGRRNLGEPAPTKFTALRLLPLEKYLSVLIPSAFISGVGAGLLRLFVGRRNLGEPAPTKFTDLRLLPSEKYLSVSIPICVY